MLIGRICKLCPKEKSRQVWGQRILITIMNCQDNQVNNNLMNTISNKTEILINLNAKCNSIKPWRLMILSKKTIYWIQLEQTKLIIRLKRLRWLIEDRLQKRTTLRVSLMKKRSNCLMIRLNCTMSPFTILNTAKNWKWNTSNPMVQT